MTLPPEHNEVSGWDVAKEIVKTSLANAQDGAVHQSRAWTAIWFAAALGTTIALAFAHAPFVAYAIPAAVVLIAPTTAIRRRRRHRR